MNKWIKINQPWIVSNPSLGGFVLQPSCEKGPLIEIIRQ